MQSKKANIPYILFFVFWLIFSGLSFWYMIVYQWNHTLLSVNEVVVKIFIVINWIVINFITCIGIKDFITMVTYFFYIKNKPISKFYLKNEKLFDKGQPKVLLLYLTCDDFDSNSLLKSIEQDYDNFKIYILDDSKKDTFKNEINDFCAKYQNINLIRRNNISGFKAGNINNFLMNTKEFFDYFVILDSDEIIPKNFIKECLLYFTNDIGIIQANHKATRTSNFFDKLASNHVLPYWTISMSFKNLYGTTPFYGHGAMISRNCYFDCNGFPEIVTEDIGFLIKSLNKGYKSLFLPHVICEEKFPIDYLAYKKYLNKITQGHIELIKKLGTEIFVKKNFFMKLSLFFDVTSIFINLYSILLLIISFLILGPLNFQYKFQYIIWIFLIFFNFIYLISDLIFMIQRKENFLNLLGYLLFYLFFYPSLITFCIRIFTLSIFRKKAKFIVTPKNSKKYTIWSAIKLNIWDIFIYFLFLSISIISVFLLGTFKYELIFWYVFFTIPNIFIIFFTLMSNKKNEKQNYQSYNL
ncbi:glycosyltransferase [Mycoplasmoides pirum]|uniref:glycosyltransferase n=1 Tax=Mycoplasmoides pirum TaxID=2122 RepID=UPI00138B00FE|nr:glycosyltransferase [Mycoplasmoides pirum]